MIWISKMAGFLSSILLSVLLLISCEELVYSSAELESKKKFEIISPGKTEQELLSTFGEPGILIFRDEKSRKLMCKSHSSTRSCDSFGSIDELRFLPDKPVDQKVYIYVEGTVFSYYFLGKKRIVETLEIVIS